MDWTTGPLDPWTTFGLIFWTIFLNHFFGPILDPFWSNFGPIFSIGASRLKMLTHKSTVEDRKPFIVLR